MAELAGPWQARRESDLRARRGRDRLRAEGGGRRRELAFTDRVLVTLAVLRLHTLADAIAGSKHWRSLQRWTGRREDLPETIRAIGSLVSAAPPPGSTPLPADHTSTPGQDAPGLIAHRVVRNRR